MSRTMSMIKVLVVDDSAVVRQVMGGLLREQPDFDVIAACADPLLAQERMRRQWPDVIVLDVEMPRMDGITFLRKIMTERPTPVVICSALTEASAQITLEAMSSGAVAIVTKPQLGLRQFLHDSANELVRTVRAAARANVAVLAARAAACRASMPHPKPKPKSTPTPAPMRAPSSARESAPAPLLIPRYTADALLPAAEPHALIHTTERIVAIGTSTGGTQALETVLTSLPRVCPGIVVVQHMPAMFTAAFAARLDDICAITVREARADDRVEPGQALIAPGGKHLLLRRSGAQYRVDVVDGPYVSRHRPSVDVLFRSVARCAGSNALGIIMTGMGDDGAAGLLEMRHAGARTVAQDEASCVVFGMPKEAIKRGAVQTVVPLDEIAAAIQRPGASVIPTLI
jgi:two-component system, chemotaxis family, protein-glutamate methylesterase/glutaminase